MFWSRLEPIDWSSMVWFWNHKTARCRYTWEKYQVQYSIYYFSWIGWKYCSKWFWRYTLNWSVSFLIALLFQISTYPSQNCFKNWKKMNEVCPWQLKRECVMISFVIQWFVCFWWEIIPKYKFVSNVLYLTHCKNLKVKFQSTYL